MERKIDGVFTAAGIDSCGKLTVCPARTGARRASTPVRYQIAVIRSALPFLKASGGRVVTCASTHSASRPSATPPRTALEVRRVGFSRALAAELAEVERHHADQAGYTSFFDDRDAQYKRRRTPC